MDVKLSLVKYMTKCYSMNNTNNKYRGNVVQGKGGQPDEPKRSYRICQ